MQCIISGQDLQLGLLGGDDNAREPLRWVRPTRTKIKGTYRQEWSTTAEKQIKSEAAVGCVFIVFNTSDAWGFFASFCLSMAIVNVNKSDARSHAHKVLQVQVGWLGNVPNKPLHICTEEFNECPRRDVARRRDTINYLKIYTSQ